MCETCGCSATTTPAHAGMVEHILEANNAQAAHNREHFTRHDVLAVNLMSSPGAGKTALLEATSAVIFTVASAVRD